MSKFTRTAGETAENPFGEPLQIGSAGKEVLWVQQVLERLRRGRYPELLALQPDGYYDCRTATAIEQYQSLAGLDPDGMVGQVCWNALARDLEILSRSSGEKARPLKGRESADTTSRIDDWPGGTLHPGCRGAAVELLQKRLRLAAQRDPELKVPPCNGQYDPDTEQAVREFQHRIGLREDGAADEKTWSALEERIQN